MMVCTTDLVASSVPAKFDRRKSTRVRDSITFGRTMDLFVETLQETLLVLNSDGFQRRWRKEVSESFLDGVRKRLGGVEVPPDAPQPEVPGMPRNGANGETLHGTRTSSPEGKTFS